ncbi:hypothetical protein FGG08_002347 [Glutinoglossum americanum]|uniref:MIT domain-containing protein n=1 Tax=Glutinoglossum americanum TaxID=1670608 RepID=A0A9P8IBR0_9PEZI|nr:hypothetical protein FGG08_002347 [Glutinoglossum americanum]
MANSSTAPPTTPARPLASSSPQASSIVGGRQQQHLSSSPSSNSLSSSASTVRRAGSHHSRPRSQPTAALSAAATTAVAVATLETGARSQATSTDTTDNSAANTSPERGRRPSVAHNRSHSTSGAKEGVRNPNPRSLSTNSRKSSVSSSGNERGGNLARSLSTDISGRVLHSLSPSKKHTSTKSKHSTSSPASNSNPAKSKHTIHQVHVDILPPIIVSPSFEVVTSIESSSRKGSIESTPLRSKTLPQSLQDPSDDSLEGKLDPPTGGRKPPPLSSPNKPASPPKRSTHEPPQKPPSETITLKSQVFRRESAKRQKELRRISVRGETERRGSKLNPGKNKHPSQKAMLSKALQKANTAVLLDNAQNYEGAVEAYGDACDLLQQVMSRTNGEEEKRKLQAIRSTYTRRIVELKDLTPQFKAEEKALPARPEANELYDPDDLDNYSADLETQSLSDNEEEDTIIETATVTRIINDQSYIAEPREKRTLAPSLVPPRRESLLPSAFSGGEQYIPPSPTKQLFQQRSFSKSPMREEMVEIGNHLQPPMQVDCIPPPLLMRRAPSPMKVDQKQTGLASPTNSSVSSREKDHSRANSTESTSWLDTIDESGGSSASSVHSRSSSRALRRKRLRAASGATADEFDAALDAAVEAAYDDGYVPASEADLAETDMISIARRNVEVAKERVREAERETAIQFAKEREKRRLQNAARNAARTRSDSIGDADYLEEEAEEEERLLEEMTREYMIMDDFEFDLQSKSALPRESGSSGFSGRTWGSSIGSNFTTAGTSLQTVAEAPVIPSLPQRLQSKTPPPPHPPPSGALPVPPMPTSTPPPRPPPTTAPPRPPSAAAPRPPSAAAPRPPSAAAPRPPSAAAPRPPSAAAPRPPSAAGMQNQAQGIRSRRLSGQNPKQLKVETTKATVALAGPLGSPPLLAPPKVLGDDILTAPKSASSTILPTRQLTPGPVIRPPASATPQGMFRRDSPQFIDAGFADPIPPPALSPGVSPLTRAMPHEGENVQSRTGSPGRLNSKPSAGSGNLRLALSSSSLKNRNLSVSSPDGSESSPGTPSHPFTPSGVNMRRGYGQGVPPLPTPTSGNIIPGSLAVGVGIAYFDTDIHSPYSPGSPNPMALNAPIPLEPCPSEYLLRPYWLMRCFYQTIVHNRGGYLSTKLFVPRDVWRVRGVKIKGTDEKISACDLLTAALLKLAKVDTDDADAVLEEMQALEGILDQVQVSLSKKLGNEVGVQGSQSMFKDANDNTDSAGPKSSTLSSKSYLSWKRLRSKNSNAGLTSSTFTRDNSKESFSMSTLPMASAPIGRIPKRSVEGVQFGGPNAHYLGSLARLFDAAQVLDQIARQVEDPGLKHSSQTQVGLELSTRHASEFFGFYICRFVLSDISVLLDKFIKQGSEWVLV